MKIVLIVLACIAFFAIVHLFLRVHTYIERAHAKRNAQNISHHDLPREDR